jgi:hypothetical protein
VSLDTIQIIFHQNGRKNVHKAKITIGSVLQREISFAVNSPTRLEEADSAERIWQSRKLAPTPLDQRSLAASPKKRPFHCALLKSFAKGPRADNEGEQDKRRSPLWNVGGAREP